MKAIYEISNRYSVDAALADGDVAGRGAFILPFYARVITFVSGGAYFSVNYLKPTLGLDDAVGKDLVSQLKQDGQIGDIGRSGLMFWRK